MERSTDILPQNADIVMDLLESMVTRASIVFRSIYSLCYYGYYDLRLNHKILCYDIIIHCFQDVKEYDSRIVEQLMNFMYRYTSEVLQDAQRISTRCGASHEGEVGVPDVLLAIQNKGHRGGAPPPLSIVLKIAQQRNQAPLPEIQTKYGLRLPPENECLLNPSYQFAPPRPQGNGNAMGDDGIGGMDQAAVESRRKSSYNVQKRHGGIVIDAMPKADEPMPDYQADEEELLRFLEEEEL